MEAVRPVGMEDPAKVAEVVAGTLAAIRAHVAVGGATGVRLRTGQSLGKGVLVAEASKSSVMLKAENRATVTYATIDAPTVKGNSALLSLERLIAYLQTENDIVQVNLARDRMEQDMALSKVRHEEQMKRIEANIAEMKKKENKSLASKIFGFIKDMFSDLFVGALPGGPIMMIVFMAMHIMELTGKNEELRKDYVKNHSDGTAKSKRAAEKKFDKTWNGLKTAESVLSAGAQIAIAIAVTVLTFGSGAAAAITAAMKAVIEVINAVTAMAEAASKIAGAIEDKRQAELERNVEVSEAKVRKSEAAMKEVKALVDEVSEEVKDLLELLQKHYENFQAIVRAHLNTEMQLAHRVGA